MDGGFKTKSFLAMRLIFFILMALLIDIWGSENSQVIIEKQTHLQRVQDCFAFWVGVTIEPFFINTTAGQTITLMVLAIATW